ncbi:hypothetical protein Syun_015068 [Stephania yunnanensis]|uniref:Uncharacterized protein n=1 Tax=Stephania yunnanensis TaxID=152371 RepID=A0AAP0JM80_9MAGN
MKGNKIEILQRIADLDPVQALTFSSPRRSPWNSAVPLRFGGFSGCGSERVFGSGVGHEQRGGGDGRFAGCIGSCGDSENEIGETFEWNL